MAAPTNLIQLYHSEGVPDKLKGRQRVQLLKEIEGTFALTEDTLLVVPRVISSIKQASLSQEFTFDSFYLHSKGMPNHVIRSFATHQSLLAIEPTFKGSALSTTLIDSPQCRRHQENLPTTPRLCRTAQCSGC